MGKEPDVASGDEKYVSKLSKVRIDETLRDSFCIFWRLGCVKDILGIK